VDTTQHVLRNLFAQTKNFERREAKRIRVTDIEHVLTKEDIQSRIKHKVSEKIWNIVSALRGPDATKFNDNFPHDIDTLKELTTGRIRGLIGHCSNSGAVIHSEPLTEEEIEERDKLLIAFSDAYGDHFYHHFIRALIALNDFGFPISDEELNAKNIRHNDDPF
jgi:hypothetical protein